jgi:hypothetical protein
LRKPTALSIVCLMRALPRVGRWAAVVAVAIVTGRATVVDAGGYGPGSAYAVPGGPGACVGCTAGSGPASALPGYGYGSGPGGYGRYGHGHCGHGHCGHGHCGHGHCGHGHCGHGHCGHGLCDALCGPGSKHDAAEKRYFLRSQGKSWHSAWYDPAEGRPIALVVPPTAEFQTQYGWGVPSSRVMPIYHQFRRPYPGPGAVGGAGGGFMPTPNQPSDTVQFGVNAVRGPWGAY